MRRGRAAPIAGSIFQTRGGPRGWARTIIVVLFMGSVQLIRLGINGEYVRLIFLEAKQRPSYIVRKSRRRPDVDGAIERRDVVEVGAGQG